MIEYIPKSIRQEVCRTSEWFSSPTKMRSSEKGVYGISWNLPAVRTCPGAVFSEDSICNQCYARSYRYCFNNVKRALNARLEATRSPLFVNSFVSALIDKGKSLSSKGKIFLRLHDSGDIYSTEYAKKLIRIFEVAKQVLNVSLNIWAPTKAYVREDILPHLVTLNTLATVRPSASIIGSRPPVIEGLSAGCTTDVKGTCSAIRNKSSCSLESCRKCWDEPHNPVVYGLH